MTAAASTDRRTRRGKGRIRQLPSGRHQAAYVGPDSQLHKADRTFFYKHEAEAWIGAELRMIELGTWTPPEVRAEQAALAEQAAAPAVTFGTWFAAWLADRSDPHGTDPLRPTTAHDYQRLAANHLLPSLAGMPLDAIDEAAVTSWWRERGMVTSPTMRAKAYRLLSQVMAAAAADPAVPAVTATPCRIKAGRITAGHDAEPATLDDLAAIRAALAARRPQLALTVDLAAWCALRYGELAELRRGDVKATRNKATGALEAAVLRIRRNVTWTAGRVHVGPPKTAAGRRDVTVPPHLLATLDDHLARYTAAGADALLFPAATGTNRQMRENAFYKHWLPARDTVRPDLHFHDLRHTGATFAAQAGATTRELMDRLGHSTPGMAMHYQHTAAGRDAQVAAALSQLASPSEPEPEGPTAADLAAVVEQLRKLIADQAAELAQLRAQLAEAAR